MSLRKTLGDIFNKFISKNQFRIYMSEQMVDRIESRMEEVQQAQDRFARAMTQYAEHLKSHTSAIEGLNKASHELANNAADQNKVLTRLIEFMKQPPAGIEQIIPKPEEETIAKNIVFPPGCYRRRRLQNKKVEVLV